MKKIIAFSLLSLLSVGSLAPAVLAEEGDETQTLKNTSPIVRGQILNLFKKKHEQKLADTPFTKAEDFKVFETETRLDALSKILKNLENKQDALREEKEPVADRRAGIESIVKTINDQISENTVALEKTKENITETEASLFRASQKINRLNRKISSSRSTISKYFEHMYLLSDRMYDNTNEVDLVRGIVLDRGNVADAWSDLHFKGLLQARGKEYVNEYRSIIENLSLSQKDLEAEKTKHQESLTRLEALQKQLDLQKGYKEKILGIIAGREHAISRSIALRQTKADLVRDRIADTMEEYISSLQELQEKYKCTSEGESCTSVSQYFVAEKQLREIAEVEVVPFTWPVEPNQGISAYFRDADYFSAFGSQHEAIDIVTPQSTAVTAAADGYLLYAEQPAPGKYSYAVIKHIDGWITVYGHLSEISVPQFTFLKRGQVFAKSGGKPGEPGSGPMTSGAHLHFEVYHKNEAVDPLRHLNVAEIPLEMLDSKYVYKYAEDFRKKYGPRMSALRIAESESKKFFFIPGSTEIERQKNMLSTYAAKPFQNWELWAKAGNTNGIETSMLLCIGLAETRLGNTLKSRNNIGNIGNDDSGNTRDFTDAKAGIAAIAYTLNNKYLAQYDTIDQLSRWGNEDGKIYASSNNHWHDNMVRCLSALKGRFVEDNFTFRYQ